MYSFEFYEYRVTFLSVSVSFDLSLLKGQQRHGYNCTDAPFNSWKDPAERIMSILNRGLQSVGLMRAAIEHDDIEDRVTKCQNMKEIRNLAASDDEVRGAVINSVEPVKRLMEETFKRLSLKGKNFKKFHATTEAEINNL